MRSVYLKSIKDRAVGGAFVFREPRRQMNRSDIYSQVVDEQDTGYELDSFCVEDDELIGDNTVDDAAEITMLDVVPVPSKDRYKRGKEVKRKRIIVHSDSSQDEQSPDNNNMRRGNLLRVDRLPSSIPPSAPIAPQTPTTSLNVTSREERLKLAQQKRKQLLSKLSTESVVAATSSNNSANNQDKKSGITAAVAGTVSVCSTVTISSTVSKGSTVSIGSFGSGGSTSRKSILPASTVILMSSRQVAICNEIVSHLRIHCRCMPHVCQVDGADFVVGPQVGVVRKLHSGCYLPSSLYNNYCVSSPECALLHFL